MCGRVIAALKSQALLDESVGAGYIERNWPPALKAEGAWPLASLRQSFLNGSLTRLIDPDAVLRGKIGEFVAKGEFGLGSGRKADGGYDRVWFEEPLAQDEVTFEPGVFLLLKAKTKALRLGAAPLTGGGLEAERGAELGGGPVPEPTPPLGPEAGAEPAPDKKMKTLRISGDVPAELWNRLGVKILPKLKCGTELKIGVDFSVTVDEQTAQRLMAEIKQILEDLELATKLRIE